jgi:ABC-type branched-subunit amino acid transport system ATPase component
MTAERTAQALLAVSDLVSGYGTGQVVSGLSLQIMPGERVGLMGRTGAGKTTLLRTLMGLLPARNGSISFAGHDLVGRATFETAKLGLAYVPQGRQLFADMSIEQNLRVAGMAHGLRDLSVAWNAFPWLKVRRNDRAGSLSGGQQQQLAIARALIARPRLVLLDEPLEGVQPSMVQDIIAGLQRLCSDSGVALLFVEQNIEAVLGLCTRVAFVERGHIVHGCSSEAVREHPEWLERYLGV